MAVLPAAASPPTPRLAKWPPAASPPTSRAASPRPQWSSGRVSPVPTLPHSPKQGACDRLFLQTWPPRTASPHRDWKASSGPLRSKSPAPHGDWKALSARNTPSPVPLTSLLSTEQGEQGAARPASSHGRRAPTAPLRGAGAPPPGAAGSGTVVEVTGSYSQRMTQLSYVQYQHRGIGWPAELTLSKGAAGVAVPALWAQLPAALRPDASALQAEAKELGCTLVEALVSLLVGRRALNALAPTPSTGSGATPSAGTSQGSPEDSAARFPGGVLDFKAWQRAIRVAWGRGAEVPAERALAAVALLHPAVGGTAAKPGGVPAQEHACGGLGAWAGTAAWAGSALGPESGGVGRGISGSSGGVIHTLDFSAAGLESIPETLKLFPSVQMLNLSRNPVLTDLRGARVAAVAGAALRALDLSGCAELSDLSPLAALPALEALSLARCTALGSVAELFAALTPEAASQSTLSTFARLSVSAAKAPPPALAARHGCTASLRWLSLDGCSSLHEGVQKLSSCPVLEYLDLFECLAVPLADCWEASQAPALRAFIWPELAALEAAARSAAAPAALHGASLRLATAAAGEKLARAVEGRRTAAAAAVPSWPSGWLAPLEPCTAEAELAAARRAAAEFRLGAGAGGASVAAPLRSASTCRGGGHQANGEVGTERVSPVAFSKALRLQKFDFPGVEASDVFRVIDQDRKGYLVLSDLRRLSSGPPRGSVSDAAVAALVLRRRGLWEACARDLSGGRAVLDPSRLAACLAAVGTEDAVGQRVAMALCHCAAGVLPRGTAGDPEAALRHALAPFVVAGRAAALGRFADALQRHFPKGGFAEALAALTAATAPEEASRDRLSIAALRRLSSARLALPEEEAEVAVEVLLSAMCPVPLARARSHTDCSNVRFAPEDFLALGTALAQESPQQTVVRLTKIGRRFAECPAKLQRCLPEDIEEISFPMFSTCWSSIGEGLTSPTTASVAFALLDLRGQGWLSATETKALLLDALPRRAEAAALGEVEDLLWRLGDGSWQEAHNKLVDAQGALILDTPLLKVQQSAKPAVRHVRRANSRKL